MGFLVGVKYICLEYFLSFELDGKLVKDTIIDEFHLALNDFLKIHFKIKKIK